MAWKWLANRASYDVTGPRVTSQEVGHRALRLKARVWPNETIENGTEARHINDNYRCLSICNPSWNAKA